MAPTRRSELQAAVRSLGLPKLERELALRGMDKIAPADADAFLDDVAKVRKLLPALKARRFSSRHLHPTVVKNAPAAKARLVAAVLEKTPLSKSKAIKAVDAVFTTIAEALREGKEVRLRGFGTFSVASRAASEGRNPRTGERVKVAASRQAKFKPGMGLRDSLS